jgi:hypothetical protein
MGTHKSAEPDLWKVANELPYKESKFSTTERNFTPSWPKRQAMDFVPLVLKKIGAHTKN